MFRKFRSRTVLAGVVAILAIGLLYLQVPTISAVDTSHAIYAAGGVIGPWQATMPLGTARMDFALARSSDHVYVLGGCTNCMWGSTATVEGAPISPSGDIGPWQNLAPMTLARQGVAALISGNYLFALGGSAGSPEASVERALINDDGSLGAWERASSMTTPRFRFAAVVIGDYLYALGGLNGSAMSSVERALIHLDSTLGNWEPAPSMAVGRMEFSAFVAGNYLYALGGEGPQYGGMWASLGSVERAPINPDDSLGPWQIIGTMPTPRHAFAAVYADGGLYVLGGNSTANSSTSFLNTVDKLMVNADGSLGAWQSMPAMLATRSYFGSTAVNSNLYAFGGSDPNGGVLQSVERAAFLDAPPTATTNPYPMPPTATTTPYPMPPTATTNPYPMPPTATPNPYPMPPTATPNPYPMPPTATWTPSSVQLIPVGSNPYAVAVNSVTNKVYVASGGTNNVTVIDGATNGATTVPAGTVPMGETINSVTNKVYVANYGSANVTVIDGATNSITTVAVGVQPFPMALNPVTNKVYVANSGSADVTVIDGATNRTTFVAVGTSPWDVAVNPVTNRVYVANWTSNNVTVIDGATNLTSMVAAGTNPVRVAVNPVTNKVYVANQHSANVTVIDGATNGTTTIAAGTYPQAVAVNPVTNKVYVANWGSDSVTVIDGATNGTTFVAVGRQPVAMAVNLTTNKVYVANQGSANVTVIDGATNGTTTIAAGSGPGAVAVNPATNQVYIANRYSNNVTVIGGTPPLGTTPPEITPNATCDNPGNAPWCKGTITVSWTVTDSESPILSTSGCEMTTVSSNTPATGITFTCTAASAGGTTSRLVTVFRDGTPPEITPAVTCDNPGNAPWCKGIITVSWTVTDPESPVISANGCETMTVSSDTPATGTPFTCTAASAGGTTSRSVTVFRDGTAPTMACSVSPNSLWPPNHQLKTVTASVTEQDSSSGPAGFALVSVTSNEPGGAPDAIQGFDLNTPDTSGQLRAERSGKGNGRIYTLTYQGMDAAGNASTCDITVTVPHDLGH